MKKAVLILLGLLHPSTGIMLFLLFFCFATNTIASADQQPLYDLNCTNGATYSANSSYQYNLFNLLNQLISEASLKGFNEIIYGTSPNQVYGRYLCRGDVSHQSCKSCVETAKNVIVDACPNHIKAVIWYDNCTIQYSNESFFGTVDTSWPFVQCNPFNVTENFATFEDQLNTTLRDIAARAAKGDQFDNKFASQQVNYSESITLYELAQCVPDLSVESCRSCLTDCVDELFYWCHGTTIGGKVYLGTSCSMRYETFPFFNQTAPTTPAPAPAPAPAPDTAALLLPAAPLHQNGTHVTVKGEPSKKIFAIASATAAVTLTLLISTIFICLVLRRKARKKYEALQAQTGVTVDIELPNVESLQYDWETLQIATNNFSAKSNIGRGGFGVVYKGTLADGLEIAVKRLTACSYQGIEEFKNEVVLVAKLQHKNLVRLLGFCLTEEEKILVYEFVPNKSLDYFLFDPEKRVQLNWTTRYKVISGVARGLVYLHEDSRLRIIHRDLKASNILLDAYMNPKISDFGTARLIGVDQSLNETTRAAGTLGYMAPEYLLYGQFSTKSDVYSFGVLTLEIVSGRKVRNFQQSGKAEDLLSDAWEHWKDGRGLEFMDPTLKDSHYSIDEVMRCIQLGLLCVQHDADKRPSMTSIIHQLNSTSSIGWLPVPQRPVFFTASIVGEPNSSSIGRGPTSDLSTSKSMMTSSSGTEATLTDAR